MTGPGPGFFGKLRTHGDFVARRVAPSLHLNLDDWLQRALTRSRQDMGAGWLPAWLNAPLWRFVLAPGVGAAQACAGVMMPSLDRVDRAFPLVLALELEAAPALAACIGPYSAWFAALEDLALSSLERDFSLDAFDAALRALGGPVASIVHATPDDASAAPHWPALPSGAGWFSALDGAALPSLAHVALAGRSAWWTDGAPTVAPCLAVCDGLPGPTAFAALLDGAWEARGWRCA